jgi:hypothetical protein
MPRLDLVIVRPRTCQPDPLNAGRSRNGPYLRFCLSSAAGLVFESEGLKRNPHKQSQYGVRVAWAIITAMLAVSAALALPPAAAAATPAQAAAKVIVCFQKNHVAAKKTSPFPGVLATFPGYNHFHWYSLGWIVVHGHVSGVLTAHSPLGPAELAIGRRCSNAWRR